MAETGTVPTYRRAGGIGRLLERYPFLPALVIVAALLLLNGFFSPNSLTFRALTGLLSTYMALILLAIAQTYVVYAGDIDLSAGAILSLVNVAIVVLMERWGGGAGAVFLALAIGLLLGLACGLVNGLVVAALRLQAIVATFATSIFFTGLALCILPVAGTPAPALFWRTYGGRLFGVPFVFYILAALVILLAVMSRTRLVTQLLAVGDDQQAAYQTGLPVIATRIKGYVLCGLFSALAAFCITGDTASGDPLVGGKMTLYSVAAVVLGGSALSGGWGTVVGSLLGALTIGLINSVVFFMGTPSEWQNFVQGLAILLVLMAGVLAGRRARS
ncbi:ABC transporter permease [Sinorhizobium meliloti]|uniref:ABC transporter permease n=1 Tax=Rhizobium meliloti TaxID=382 RepID=UPI000FD7FB49|nr:ABC transporter permease [Sinorhizobium meliloti]TWB01190.1 monosaccharide ABC transporter membrane protein (CUT2 family) [Ensifer sp. SEMIA 134]TWB38472.1 monosaccharide ABC transporter membrane protein (CUT2 family) [Ensifer sp. SEMIA 135]MDW9611146.1 ABC transporter permease [Sinorhizobium meliloti]MDW9628662.1 ABC transporter permease [Sinorhizobium meliloti]MDW9767779.1 ABC transporter permease [Sinorhizobium meliloti]